MTPKDEKNFQLLDLLQHDPALSQREMADRMRVSLGSVNYCLGGLVEKGHVRVKNFRNSDNKRRYVYVLTPSGIRKRSALLAEFLKRKTAEYNSLKADIDRLAQELGDGSGRAS
ncbi:MAG: MarR family EPS-associated transcriptional regulator [Litorimonas sp.]